MKLTSMQFDGDGGYDTPLNSGATASVGSDKDYKDSAGETVAKPVAPTASSAYQSGDDNIARNSAAAGRAAKADKIATAMTPTPGIDADDAHKGMMARSNAMSPMTQAEPAAKAKTKAPIDKSKWDRSIKVSQSTVDAVKDAGRGNMGKNPQRTVKNDAIGLSSKGYVGSQMQYNAPVSAEYKEAVKRIYPNEVKSKPSPTFNESSPKGKAFPKIAAPKTKLETVKKLRNAEIEEANKTAPDGKFTAAVINAAKGGMEAYGAGTQNRYQIPGTQTKTQKAQAAAKADRAASVATAKKKK